MFRITSALRSATNIHTTKLIKNKIPKYITFLSNYLSIPIHLNENEYITKKEDKQNKDIIYRWTQHPCIKPWLATHHERQKGILFRHPEFYDDNQKNC
tara:strand:- start:735 stop:1028 length:294 start_codon:yes stop_codon:yes gene_type:complete